MFHLYVTNPLNLRSYLLNASRINTCKQIGTCIALNWILMRVTDFIIIYFACGAPFGVYFFTSNKNMPSNRKLWLKSFFVFVFWFPFFLGFIYKKDLFGKFLGFTKIENTVRNTGFEINEKKIFSIQKSLEQIIKRSGIDISIYQFRNVFERYAGLTLALNDQIEVTSNNESVFGVAGHSNIELAQICQNRRNRKHLSFHQINALEDFLKVIRQLSFFKVDDFELRKLSIEFVEILGDERAVKRLVEIFDYNQQTQKKESVKRAEEKLWKTAQHEQVHANRLPIRLKAMHALATMNLRKKD